MTTILETIVASRARQVDALKQQQSIDGFVKRIEAAPRQFRSLSAAIRRGKEQDGIAVIAEVKRASPSKGILCESFDHMGIAGQYEQAGASAISVLTEPSFFMGDNRYLTQISAALSTCVLRKDFIIDPIQIYEARAIGADAILLIAEVLDTKQLREYMGIAASLGLECLCEAHDERQLYSLLEAGADIVGVNNRNLANFQVSLATTEQLRRLIPSDKLLVSESGIHTRADVCRLIDIGADAMLVGESLVKAASIAEKLRELLGRAK